MVSTDRIHIEQDLIDELCLAPECSQLFERVLGREPGECLLTDLSTLSDFVGSGVGAPSLAHRSYKEYLQAWDNWALAKIREEFSLDVPSTSVTLVALISLLRGRPNRQPH